jgi:hypothetical protein
MKILNKTEDIFWKDLAHGQSRLAIAHPQA